MNDLHKLLASTYEDVLSYLRKGEREAALASARQAVRRELKIGKVTHWIDFTYYSVQHINHDKSSRGKVIHVEVGKAVMDDTPG